MTTGARVDLERVRSQCERIRAEFRRLYDWIPLRPLTGEAVARWAELKGPLCRRVLAAVQHRGEPAELARILPGVDGLELFVAALERRGCPPELCQAARGAVAAFAELIHEGGGSQRRLVAALREAAAIGPGAAEGGADGTAVRARMHEAASTLTGSACDAMVVVTILYRSRERSGDLDSIGALGQLGYRARPDAAPLMAKHYAPVGVEDETELAGPADSLHQRFGTPDLAITRARIDERRVLTTYDGRHMGERPIDVWSGPVRNRGVSRLEPGGDNGYGTLAAVRTPVRTLVHDLWVEAPLANSSVLRAGAYRATPDAFGTIDYKQWYDRLPGEPRILLPGADLLAGLERIHPRHVEVLDHCFEAGDLRREGFVCHRCVVEFPIWMAIYRLTLEFPPTVEPRG
ncbi:hypothetical protein Pla86_04540 [Planctomycetes bacterium Pla86]|uniref:Uncharacterized protein n=1 Tax=Engelhardtia mirabilis TaxID=2528011 RepID=A0A518BEH2_9BACT|nr:hypothetical protein Pla133_04540 [Planctomycetes bacterium Pla133]QDU99715.1 hypothetical protein Pla86_04540 [Planctomycetes bacterium Pla86]